MKRFLIFASFLFIINCDDGDALFEDFDFDNITVQACLPENDAGTRNYTFYKIETVNNETLSIQVSSSEDLLEEGIYDNFSVTSNPFEYRKFNGTVSNDYFCNDVPPSSPNVTETFIANAGTFIITTEYSFDDGDGIPAIDEDLNNNGDLEDDDTDGDGIPNYRDEDDDGDNVPTSQEGVNTSDLSQSRDTDGDGDPDYLDRDDDDDGINTDQETTDGDANPANDGPANLRNYLNPLVSGPANPPIDTFIEHTYTRQSNVEITLFDVTLSNGNSEIIYEEFDFGTYVGNGITITENPPFN